MKKFIRIQSLLLILIAFTLIFSSSPAFAAQIQLAWDPNTEPDVAGYRIYYGLLSGQYSDNVDVGNQTSCTLSNLQEGNTYYLAATTYDREGYESNFSNEVVFNALAPCTYSISPINQSFGAGGGTGTVNITTTSGCNWTALSNASWLVITSNSGVTGSGPVNYSVLSNSSTSTRTGTLTVAGQTFTVTQSGALPPTITTNSPLPSGTAGTAYSKTLQATNGTTPYSWSIVSGSLPPGLSLNSSTGVISGTPTAANTYNFRARVTGSNALYSEKDFSLTINPATLAIFNVSPNGGETWAAGTTQTIRWNYTGNVGSFVKVELLKAGGVSRTITSSTSKGSGGNGSYNWKIPSNQSSGTDYKIRVTSTSNSAYTDSSDSNFTIQGPPPPGIFNVSPNGGETWAAGTTQTIRWNYTGNVGSFVKVELLKAGGVSRTITSSTSKGGGGNGSYNWKIPSNQSSGTDYKIRVTSTSNSAYTDSSDSNFTIK